MHVIPNISQSLNSALTLLVGWQEGHMACKKTEWRGAGVVICLERGADLHMAQLTAQATHCLLVSPFWYRLCVIKKMHNNYHGKILTVC